MVALFLVPHLLMSACRIIQFHALYWEFNLQAICTCVLSTPFRDGLLLLRKTVNAHGDNAAVIKQAVDRIQALEVSFNSSPFVQNVPGIVNVGGLLQ